MLFRKNIELREGVKVEILVTPALYRVAQSRGIDLSQSGSDKDPFTPYIKMLYCAAINAWEVEAIDDPDKGEFPYKYRDFDDWAWTDTERLGKAIEFMYQAITGKPLQKGIEDVKKKRTTKTRQ